MIQTVLTWYRERPWDIIEVTWFDVERSKIKVRGRIRVQQFGVGSNFM